jgi:hypothetical protein
MAVVFEAGTVVSPQVPTSCALTTDSGTNEFLENFVRQ